MSKTLEDIIAAPSLVREQWLPTELAVREVLAFERRFGSKHLMLACHAALPLILTPQLLNLIHVNFLNEQQIPWVAEVDFLLSPLCRPIDEGLFEVEPAIREVLLVELENQFGWQRPYDLAKFLLVYLQQKPERKQRSDVGHTQWWIAQAYLNPDGLIKEITNVLDESFSKKERFLGLPGQIKVITMLEILSEPLDKTNLLTEHLYLVNNSRILAQIIYKDGKELIELFRQEGVRSDIVAGDRFLIYPAILNWLEETNFDKKNSLNLPNTSSNLSNINVSINLENPDSDNQNEELREAVEALKQQLINAKKISKIDKEQKTNLFAAINPMKRLKNLGVFFQEMATIPTGFQFILGLLTAEVSIENIKALMEFVGDRMSGKSIELTVEANGTKLEFKASSQQELMEAIEAAKQFLERE